MEKLKIPFPIIVEGKYDKIKLTSVLDAPIYTTDGFGIFRKKDTMALFRALAKKSPIILLTDSDGAGKVIRSRITSAIPRERLIQLYVPRIEGKERRKTAPSAAGLLGVEGMDATLLRTLFAPYALQNKDSTDSRVALLGETDGFWTENPLSKTDFFEDGLTGAACSREKRARLAESLGLPPDMTPNALLSALKALLTYDEYLALVGRKQEKSENDKRS